MIVKIKKTGLRLVTGVVTSLGTISSWALEPLLQRIGKPYINFRDKRFFPSWFKANRFKWHMDDEDRIVEALHNTDWMFQLEDELPVPLNKPIFIKKHQWHRLVKGSGHLFVRITKICDT